MPCCPKPAAISAVTDTVCEFLINQIHRVWVLRKEEVIWDIANNLNNVGVPTGAGPDESSGWTALKAAVDSTKVGFFPLFGGEPEIVAGGEITFGGGSNETLNGKRQHIGFDPSEFIARFDGLTSQQEREINTYVCEADDLEVYFIMHDRTIVGAIDTLTTNLFTGIPIESAIALMGREVKGFAQKDSNKLSFQLPKEWSETMHKITPVFNTLTF